MQRMSLFLLLTTILTVWGTQAEAQEQPAPPSSEQRRRQEAQDYWDQYWHWYDTRYRPFYHRRDLRYRPDLYRPYSAYRPGWDYRDGLRYPPYQPFGYGAPYYGPGRGPASYGAPYGHFGYGSVRPRWQ